MFALVLALALGAENYVCWKNNGHNVCILEGNRVAHGQHTGRAGGRSGPSGAFFEFAPLSGAGMGTACACANVTGAKGETVSWTRGSSAYCTKQGFGTSGIAPGDLVQCSSNLPRVCAYNSGVLGALGESGRTNIAIRNREFDNAAWVSTATVTADTTLAPNNLTQADTLSDIDGAGIQTSCQTVVTSSAVQFSASAYIRAGTLGKASVRMTGTGSSTGDCVVSSTSLVSTYNRLGCTSPAAYGGTLTAITICVEVGTVATDTGTVIAWGAQLEAGAWVSSVIDTAAAASTRVADGPVQAAGVVLTGLGAAGSSSASVSPLNVTAPQAPIVFMNGAGRAIYANTSVRTFDGTNEAAIVNGLTVGVAERYWSSWSGATLQINNSTDATSASVAFDGAMDTTGPLEFIANAAIGTSGDWIISRICLDPNPLRCR
jgi:hypothetical protein